MNKNSVSKMESGSTFSNEITHAAAAAAIEAKDHHVQAEFCTTRAAYRQGKELKAVKVYTINDESQHLLFQNVPSIGLLQEVRHLAAKFGRTEKVELLSDYPTKAEFTHVYYVKYSNFHDARQAKKKLDNRSFFGSLLHICYAPELESVDECRKKLKDRTRSIQKRWKLKNQDRVTARPRQIHGGTLHASPTMASSSKSEEGTWSNLIPSSSIIKKNKNPQ